MANKGHLITGGNSGIGLAAAQEFDRKGARVAVKLDHVTRTYRRDEFEVRALDDVSLTIPTQGFVAIMGPSGSGKTTLLNLVAGIDHATSGSVVVGEAEITTMNERELAAWRARHIGLVFQFYNLIPVLTALENVELPLLLTHLSKAERKTHVESALKAVGLADRMEHYPRQLSGGQEQRVAIARAISPTRRFWWRMNRPATWTPNLRKKSCSCLHSSIASFTRRSSWSRTTPARSDSLTPFIGSTRVYLSARRRAGCRTTPRVSLQSPERRGGRMTKFTRLIFTNLLRSKRRTVLTVLSIAVSLFIFAVLVSLPTFAN